MIGPKDNKTARNSLYNLGYQSVCFSFGKPVHSHTHTRFLNYFMTVIVYVIVRTILHFLRAYSLICSHTDLLFRHVLLGQAW